MTAIQNPYMFDKTQSLLMVFGALMTERSVTRAAARLHLTQPALSHALSRLREALGDELFVRVARGVVPTPRCSRQSGAPARK